MAKFMRKSDNVVVEAIQWNGDNEGDIKQMAKRHASTLAELNFQEDTVFINQYYWAHEKDWLIFDATQSFGGIRSMDHERFEKSFIPVEKILLEIYEKN